MTNGDEKEVLPQPTIPKMYFLPIKFNVPTIPLKPTHIGVKCAECAGGVAEPYVEPPKYQILVDCVGDFEYATRFYSDRWVSAPFILATSGIAQFLHVNAGPYHRTRPVGPLKFDDVEVTGLTYEHIGWDETDMWFDDFPLDAGAHVWAVWMVMDYSVMVKCYTCLWGGAEPCVSCAEATGCVGGELWGIPD